MSSQDSTSPSAVLPDVWQRIAHTLKSTQIVRLIYNHNPFYVASAWLVFSGLRMSFDTEGGDFQTSALTLGLFAFTLLLSVTAIVRRSEPHALA